MEGTDNNEDRLMLNNYHNTIVLFNILYFPLPIYILYCQSSIFYSSTLIQVFGMFDIS